MTKDEIYEEFGEDLTDNALNELEEYFTGIKYGDSLNSYVVVNSEMERMLDDGTTEKGPTPGILAGLEVHPLYPYDTEQ
jgi:hypothetical protein